MDIEDTIDRGLEELQRLALARAGTAEEWSASLEKFSGRPAVRGDDPIARRHREWFLLERTSEVLGDVPAQALAGDFDTHADRAVRDVLAWLLDSRVGVFEVRDVQPGSGLWLNDLMGLGALPVREPRASMALVDGDLVVGRVFGLGDGQFVLSSAMSVFRSAGLVEALRNDVERVRAGRRGSLRIGQSELEAMFFVAEEGPDPVATEQRVFELLREAGWDDEDCAELASTMQAALGGDAELANAAIAAVLERVAFESETDLSAVRRALADWWSAIRSRAVAAPSAAAPRSSAQEERAREERAHAERARAADARAALAAFDEGRAKGRDLDALIARLEADLGLDGDDAEDPGPAPDFPGVVGAMVEEYLWEREQEEPGSTARWSAPLRALATLQQELGLFEELDEKRLLAFAARSSIEHDLCGDEDSDGAMDLLHALRDFAQWADREHDLSLWSEFENAWTQLTESLPRALAINRRLVRPVGLDWSSGSWLCVDADLVHATRGHEQFEIETTPGLDALREGDWLVGRVHGGLVKVAAVLPPQARRLH